MSTPETSPHAIVTAPSRPGLGRLSRAAERLAGVIDHIDRAAAYLAAGSLAFMMVIQVTEVLLRSLLTTSTLVADEFASYMLAACSFLALGHTLRTGGHLRVRLIAERWPPALRRRLEIGLIVASFAAMSVFTGWLVRFVFRTYLDHVDSMSQLATPLWIPQSVLCIGAAIFDLALISRLIRILQGGAVR